MNLRSQLQEFEGLRLNAYLDTVGIWTIGYGHTGKEVKAGLVWTKERSEAQLDEDIAEKIRQCKESLPWFDGLNEPRKAVVVGMCFQLGLNGMLGFKRTLASMRDERWADAANGMMNSKWARQTPKRVRRLAMQIETGEWQ